MRTIAFGFLALGLALVGCTVRDEAGRPGSAAGAGLSHEPATLSISDAVVKLEEEDGVLPGPARGDAYRAGGATTLDAVKAYIRAKYRDDTEIGDAYTFVDKGDTLVEDQTIAGTLETETALKLVDAAIASYYDGYDKTADPDATAKARRAKVRELLEIIAKQGGTFGFDGFEQSGCAAPTPWLLVIDRSHETVYGIDLNPCRES